MKNEIIAFSMAFTVGCMFNIPVNGASVSAVKAFSPVIAKSALQDDWTAYKKEQQEKIQANEKRIAELKKERNKTDQSVNNAYNKRIEKLEQKNAELNARLTGYKYDKSKWGEFKREFNHDMDELGKAFKDLGKDNVK